MSFSLDQLDILTFERAERQATALSKSSKSVAANQQLRNAYFNGSHLAELDANSGNPRSAAEVIEYGLNTIGLQDVDAVSNFVAGYYHRLRWMAKIS